jgi:hypothetical protein
MKVIYRSLIEEIAEIHSRALSQNRTIKHIKLNRIERLELQSELARESCDCLLDLDKGELGHLDGVLLVKGEN